MEIAKPIVEIPRADDDSICLRVCCCIRRWFLYSINPVDKNIWQQMKTFSFWFWTLIPLFPFFGVNSYFFVFAFFMIDKSDEYQLVQFILAFKKSQFLNAGVINGILGYVKYYACSLRTLSDAQYSEYVTFWF